jgi:8-oxo-dGTP pyrophosphatase MutT (NUDIX family)
MHKNIVKDIEILAKGAFSPGDITVSVSESNRKIDPFVESKIEDVWQKKLKEAAEKGKNIYNGLSYRLNSLSEKNEKLTIDFGILEFRTISSLVNLQKEHPLEREFYGNCCFVCATIKTSDGKYLLVELSGKSMNNNQFEFIGGIMETSISIIDGSSIFNNFYLEAEEEAGIRREDVSDIEIKYVFITETTAIGFYFEVHLSTSSNELKKRFESNDDPDIKNILFLDKQEYIDALSSHKGKAKNFVATIVGI